MPKIRFFGYHFFFWHKNTILKITFHVLKLEKKVFLRNIFYGGNLPEIKLSSNMKRCPKNQSGDFFINIVEKIRFFSCISIEFEN